MWRLDCPGTEIGLFLSPRFGAHSFLGQLLLLGLCLLPLILIERIYRAECRLVSRPIARALLLLRALVVGLLAFLIAYQPVLTRTLHEREPGHIRIAIDRSRSMEITDPQRSDREVLRLARAFHLHEAIGSAEQIDAWLKQCDDRGRLPDRSAPSAGSADRAAYAKLRERLDRMTRLELVQHALLHGESPFLPTLERRHATRLSGFGSTVDNLDPSALGSLTALTATGEFTDLTAPLKQALDPQGSAGKTFAVILLTDGQHNVPQSPFVQAAELAARSVPIYPVAVGARQPPRDIAILGIQAPRTVFRGSDVLIEARIDVRGIPARPLPVTLTIPGREPLVETIAHDGSDRVHDVRFPVRFDQPGIITGTVRIAPAPEEARVENNTRNVSISVADDKARVLLADQDGRWEFHYLASALARDRSIDLQTVLYRQPRTGRVEDAELRKIGHPLQALPSEREALANYDCILLGDVSPELLSEDDRTRLEQFVAERGGTLILIAGRGAMPAAYLGPEVDPNDKLARMLPIRSPAPWDAVEGFTVELTPEGRETAMLRMESRAEESESRWKKLPKLFWAMTGQAKPGATVLAVPRLTDSPTPKPGSTPPRDQALIVKQNYGFGRVLYIGTDSTWRWRLKVGDAYHHRFWGQIIRWAASDVPLLAGDDAFRFGPRKPVFEAGEDVELLARLGESSRGKAGSSGIAFRVRRDGAPEGQDTSIRVEARQLEGRPRDFLATVHHLPPGKYLVDPDLEPQNPGTPRIGGTLPADKARASFTIAPRSSPEWSDLAVNRALLDELAIRGNGTSFALEEISELLDRLAAQEFLTSSRRETPLWQSWWSLSAILLLLTAEWSVRKWAGLP